MHKPLKNALTGLLILLAFLNGCEHGPNVSVCIVDPNSNGFQCAKPDQTRYWLPFNSGANYVCTSPEDFRTVVEFCKLNNK